MNALRRARAQRLAWFFGIWAASVTLTLLVAQALRWLFARMLAP